MPTPAANEVLIQVHAAGVNRPDIAQRKGHYPAPKGAVADIPGLEVAGEITALGTSVQHWEVGDRVCALLTGGGYAEFVTVDQKQVLIPCRLRYGRSVKLTRDIFYRLEHSLIEANSKQGEKVALSMEVSSDRRHCYPNYPSDGRVCFCFSWHS